LTLYALALMAALSTASFAADYNGKLMDESCMSRNNQGSTSSPSSTSSSSTSNPSSSSMASCNATTATTSFALEANGKTYKLDSAGNTKAAEAIKSRADRSAEPTKSMSQTYTAKVTGTESNGTISVESIDIQ
ncbi:MAG TPA: hypothetical protein VG672_09530, partial [Bryobacteraceae bacterium]|nr:hypothetical protein [Bryobacteraceae bacterium]